MEHEPVYTSEQAADVRGISIEQGAKSLLLKTDDTFTLCVLPGNKRLDTKKLKRLLGVKNARFATAEEVKEIMGCQIGACYPFGNLINIRMLVDAALGNNHTLSFNPGVHDKSIKMQWTDYQKATGINTVDIT